MRRLLGRSHGVLAAGCTHIWVRFPHSSDELARLVGWLAAGSVVPHVSRMCAFRGAEIRDAFAGLVGRRTVGKIVVRVHPEDEDDRNARWQFLGDMPIYVEQDDGVQFVHGSPRDPTREYVFPTDVLNPEKIYWIFEHVERIAFNGHTHAPGVMTESGLFRLPQDDDDEYALSDEKVIVNVGSVGQPRDGNNRSSYVLFDGETVLFRRVAYDVDRTVELISKVDRLPEYLALRLKEGR